MTTGKARGADALVAAMRTAGVARLFTLSGNHVMPVFDATIGSGIELLHVRHEAAAVHMADAFARLTGEVGVALVTGGPGHANAVGALYTAAMAESPVVLLSGHAPLAQLGQGAFQEMAQADIAAPLCKASWVCRGADHLAADFARAAALARAGRPGPVHLSLPSDALEAPTEGIGSLGSDPREPITLQGASVEGMLKGKRVLVLAGPVCGTRRGRERLAALEAAAGVPAVVMESPRGVADPSLGDFAAVLARADRVVLLGKRLDFTLRFGKPFAADCTFVQVDPEPAEFERTRRAVGARLAATVEAGAFAAIDALANSTHGARGDAAWLEEVRAATAFRPAAWERASAPEGRLHPVQALRPLQALLDADPDSVFVSDGGEIGQWAQACLTAPHRVINGVAGAIGAALPFALAARVARPRVPIVAVMGDGTFGFHPAEIDTAVRHGLAFVAVVGNDARWNAEYQIQLREYGAQRAVGCELRPSRYDEVARAFGGHGELVTRAEDMLPAARRALASGRPAGLNVMIEGLAAPDIRRG